MARSDAEEDDDGEAGGRGRQLLRAITTRPIHAGGAALRDQRGVEFRRRRIDASHRGAGARGAGFEHAKLGDDGTVARHLRNLTPL